jgi:calcineurin-like phosphoesterase family protein
MRWFSSDHHFDHANIIDYANRPFRDVNHMNETMVARWNKVVHPSDEVYVIGDFAMGKLEHSITYAERLVGNKFLIPGNHDRCWGGHGKSERWLPTYEAVGFTVLSSNYIMEIGGQPIELCHFPFTGDSRGTDRFSGNRPDDIGQFLLHGHIHTGWQTRDRQMNVGVDVWDFYPVSEDQVTEWIGSLL